jgi:hypothetical protein
VPEPTAVFVRIEVMVDKNNHFMSAEQMSDLIKDTPQVSDDMIFRHTLKKDFSNYRSSSNSVI